MGKGLLVVDDADRAGRRNEPSCEEPQDDESGAGNEKTNRPLGKSVGACEYVVSSSERPGGVSDEVGTLEPALPAAPIFARSLPRKLAGSRSQNATVPRAMANVLPGARPGTRICRTLKDWYGSTMSRPRCINKKASATAPSHLCRSRSFSGGARRPSTWV